MKKADLLIVSGIVLLSCSVFVAGFNTYRDWQGGITTKKVYSQLTDAMEQTETYPVIDGQETPGITIDDHRYIGILNLPSLQLSLPIIDECTDDNLNISPCCYYGTPYSGNFVIAGHNYQSHFGRIDQLKEGDTVSFMDVDGNEFRYEVAAIETISGSNREQMLEGNYDLSLFTCTFSGRNRITIRCMSTT